MKTCDEDDEDSEDDNDNTKNNDSPWDLKFSF